jgi:hypothetical protein
MPATQQLPHPFGDFIGLKQIQRENGFVAMELEAGPHHMNSYGVVNGSVAYAMLDNSMGGATASTLAESETCAPRGRAPCARGPASSIEPAASPSWRARSARPTGSLRGPAGPSPFCHGASRKRHREANSRGGDVDQVRRGAMRIATGGGQ